jgi:hypothetical protein
MIVDHEAHGRLDAQMREIKRLGGCVTMLGFAVLALGILFFILTA